MCAQERGQAAAAAEENARNLLDELHACRNDVEVRFEEMRQQEEELRDAVAALAALEATLAAIDDPGQSGGPGRVGSVLGELQNTLGRVRSDDSAAERSLLAMGAPKVSPSGCPSSVPSNTNQEQARWHVVPQSLYSLCSIFVRIICGTGPLVIVARYGQTRCTCLRSESLVAPDPGAMLSFPGTGARGGLPYVLRLLSVLSYTCVRASCLHDRADHKSGRAAEGVQSDGDKDALRGGVRALRQHAERIGGDLAVAQARVREREAAVAEAQRRSAASLQAAQEAEAALERERCALSPSRTSLPCMVLPWRLPLRRVARDQPSVAGCRIERACMTTPARVHACRADVAVSCQVVAACVASARRRSMWGCLPARLYATPRGAWDV